MGFAKDDVEAIRWWRIAAEQGYAKAQFNLGVMYEKGRGLTETTLRQFAGTARLPNRVTPMRN
jgi:TPR repeat protein